MEHPTNEYPTTPTFKKMLYDQVNVINMVKKKKKKTISFPLFGDIESREEESPKF